MKKCLVVGGASFIGANLVRRLTKLGVEVHVICQADHDFWRLYDMQFDAEIIRVDIENFGLVADTVRRIRPDVIFNAASYGASSYGTDFEKVVEVNLIGLVKLIDVCKEVGFDCFINTGSSYEYGLKASPMAEDMHLEPVTNYGIIKMAATSYCQKEAIINNLPIYTVRPFAVYGDLETRFHFMTRIFLAALRGEPVQLPAKNCVRDFMYIDDLIDLYFHIERIKPKNNFVFNGGTGKEYSFGQAVEIFKKVSGIENIDIQWSVHGYEYIEPASWCADVTLAHKELGLVVKYDLEAGIERSFEWIKKNQHFYRQDKERLLKENLFLSMFKTCNLE